MALVLLDQSATRRRDRWRRRAVRQTTSDSSSECGQEERVNVLMRVATSLDFEALQGKDDG